jgi:hypothetical protein
MFPHITSAGGETKAVSMRAWPGGQALSRLFGAATEFDQSRFIAFLGDGLVAVVGHQAGCDNADDGAERYVNGDRIAGPGILWLAQHLYPTRSRRPGRCTPAPVSAMCASADRMIDRVCRLISSRAGTRSTRCSAMIRRNRESMQMQGSPGGMRIVTQPHRSRSGRLLPLHALPTGK